MIFSAIVLLCVFETILAQDGIATQTITNLNAYSTMRPCAQDCIWDTYAGCFADNIGVAIGCIGCCGSCPPYTAATLDCYCRVDLQTNAMSYLSSCISHGCTVGDYASDISVAQSLYGSYCTSQGYSAEIAAATPANAATGSSYVDLMSSCFRILVRKNN